MNYSELGDLAPLLAGTSGSVDFGSPALIFEDLNEGPCDHLQSLRAHLTLTNADDPHMVVLAGYADVLIVQEVDNGDHPDADEMLTYTYSHATCDAAEPRWYCGVFDHLDAELEGDTVVIVTDIFIDEAVRGHKFGPWLIAELAAILPGADDSPMLVGCPRRHDLSDTPATPADTASYWLDSLDIEQLPAGYIGGNIDSVNMIGPEAAATGAVAFVPVDIAAIQRRYESNDLGLWPLSRQHLLNRETQLQNSEFAAADAADELAENEDGQPLGQFDAAFVGTIRALQTAADTDDPYLFLRPAAVVTFVGTPYAENPAADIFARVANYLSDNPELSVEALNWQAVSDDDGELLRLDLTVRCDCDTEG